MRVAQGDDAMTQGLLSRTEPLPGINWSTLGTVSAGYLLVSWGMAPISAILPTISADLQIDVSAAGWIMTSYFLLLVGTVLIMGRIGDLYGHRRVFAGGIFLFGLMSVVGGLANRLEPLLVARSIQGIGAAMVFGSSLALVAEAVPTARRGTAIGVLTMSSGLAALLGVMFSVYAAQYLSWHWAFFIPTPVAIAALIFSWRLPHGAASGSRTQIDWKGGLLLFAGLTILMLSLNHFHDGEQSFQEGAYYHLPMHILAGVLLAIFAWVETRVPQPLLDFRMLRDPHFGSGVIANGIAHMTMLASSFLLPFLLERGRGMSPSDTGFLMLGMQTFMLLCSLGAGWLYDRNRSPALSWITLGAIAAGLTVYGLGGASLPFAVLMGVGAVLGASLGGFTTVNNTAVMGLAAADKRGLASGMVETTRQLGHSVGVSLSSSIMAGALVGVAAPDLAAAYADGFQRSALAMGILSWLGVLGLILPYLPSRRSARSKRAATGRPITT
jgi:MFS transporter, DHA2 family, methylenomycin A resistance protein